MLLNNDHAQRIQVAVIGDIHDLWDTRDQVALKHLGVDLVLFVGDFGNEAVEVVRAIASLDLPIAAAFGNHDAWYTATPWGVKQCPYDRNREDRVQQQIDLLGPAHVGYRYRDFPDLGVSVVGGRPFTWGGPEWKNASFYEQRFGVRNFTESTNRMVAASQQAASETLIFLGHNGPTGLGDAAEDPCGKDWIEKDRKPKLVGGDYGDPDLRSAIDRVKTLGKRVPLVAFGHMHHTLRHTKTVLRTPVRVDADGTVYLNAACTPRIVRSLVGTRRNFSLVTLQAGRVIEVRLVWINQNLETVDVRVLYQQAAAIAQRV